MTRDDYLAGFAGGTLGRETFEVLLDARDELQARLNGALQAEAAMRRERDEAWVDKENMRANMQTLSAHRDHLLCEMHELRRERDELRERAAEAFRAGAQSVAPSMLNEDHDALAEHDARVAAEARERALKEAVNTINALHVWIDDVAGRAMAERVIGAVRALAAQSPEPKAEP